MSENRRLVAIVTTFNEEANVRECLESLSWCDEILLVDEVAKVAERNAVAIDGVVATSQQQLASMSEMVTSSATLTDLAEQLQGVLHRFETGSSEQEDPS